MQTQKIPDEAYNANWQALLVEFKAMKQLTEILPDVFVIEVEADAAEIDIEGNFLFFKRDFVGFNCVGTMKPLPEGEWQYLGYCTKDEISFDVSVLVDKFNNGAWRDYSDKWFAPDQDSPNFFLSANESFRSLLLKHRLFWVNPLGIVPRKQVYSSSPTEQDYMDETINADAIKQYQQHEANKLTGKLVVLKKVK